MAGKLQFQLSRNEGTNSALQMWNYFIFEDTGVLFYATIIQLLADSSFSFHQQLLLNLNYIHKSKKLIRSRPCLLSRSDVQRKQRGGRSSLPFDPLTSPSERLNKALARRW